VPLARCPLWLAHCPVGPLAIVAENLSAGYCPVSYRRISHRSDLRRDQAGRPALSLPQSTGNEGGILETFGCEREGILFAAFASWDVAGAKWFGYPTFWVNRANAQAEELGVSADAQGRELMDLVSFLNRST
jgi:hypothetical protein